MSVEAPALVAGRDRPLLRDAWLRGAATGDAMAQPETQNIILIGYRGSGKSAVGRRVAARLGWTLADTDEMLRARFGMTIRAMFEAHGEAWFRAREAETVGAAIALREHVISVGGGAILDADSRAKLHGAGFCVWLTAPAEVLHERIERDAQTAATRPALTDRVGIDEVRHLLAQREPLYAATAHGHVRTDRQTIDEVADEVIRRWRAAAAAAGTS
jgi:shikimate kinase